MNQKNAFLVEGKTKLAGSITPQGAKNEALQVICASLLTDQEVRINNIPEIIDVLNLIDLLKSLGVKVNKISKGSYTFKSDNVNLDYLSTKEFYEKSSRIRGSLTIIGPLLSRFGTVNFPTPGGDKIGRRRLDTHFSGFKELGADFTYDFKSGIYKLKAKKLNGAFILLDEPSVTGTANIIMASVLIDGITTIYNAASEPYIQQLCTMLNSMGANITGAGTNQIIIAGVKNLSGTTHTILPDIIETGSFIGLAALTGSEITIKNCYPQKLGMIPRIFGKLGINIEFKNNDIFIPEHKHYEINKFIDGSILTIYDGPWPMFSPDLISIILVTAIQAKGTVLIHQKMFESRLFFVDKLIDMGAQIILCDPHRATVIGLDKSSALRGITMSSPDIRAGVALLIAAISAEGRSTIYNIEQIDRGYEKIDERLNSLGAKIERI
ncbi:MAG TPA: UDP-N-acetylglucosamine 1-carboxyvinyltransferase [Ignavibacteriaceae bacterium]|nr:UDP-N-acetylglucosamine 1-carboxyvinyltransferase [Ignavibacteriaceae bacterium]